MDSRRFNSIMPMINHEWAAKVLGMQISSSEGPDLLDNKKYVEAKFGLNENNWTILERQVSYKNNGMPCFLFLVIYNLIMPVSEIITANPQQLEKLVKSREGYIVDWNYVLKLKPHKGKHNTYRYPRLDDLPEITESHSVEKGIVSLTTGVAKEKFQILGR